MASAFEELWGAPVEGCVVSRYGPSRPTRTIRVRQAAHPIPDEASVAAAQEMIGLVAGLGKNDLVVALISGGGSSLLCLPRQGVSLEGLRGINHQLLRSGATIREINAVRKSLSAIKGGRLLAKCAPARVVSYILSDVPGDDPAEVSSGPTVPPRDETIDPFNVIEKYGIALSDSVRQAILEPRFPLIYPEHETRIVGSSLRSLEAAAEVAKGFGVRAEILSDSVEGEAREVARDQARLALEFFADRSPLDAPVVLLSGGETSVAVRGDGVGGRNVEFLASLARELAGHAHIYAVAADTDGVDGAVETAGAVIDPSTFERAGSRLNEALARNDCHTLFAELGDAVVTGPTLTNVNDFRAILVMGP
jgi:glycerate 2-kinase